MECQPRVLSVAQWSCLLDHLASSSSRDLAFLVVDITYDGLQRVQSLEPRNALLTDFPSGNLRYCWYCWWKKSCTSWYVVYLCVSYYYRYYTVLYIPGGCLGFQPSTVVQKSGEPLGRWRKWNTGLDETTHWIGPGLLNHQSYYCNQLSSFFLPTFWWYIPDTANASKYTMNMYLPVILHPCFPSSETWMEHDVGKYSNIYIYRVYYNICHAWHGCPYCFYPIAVLFVKLVNLFMSRHLWATWTQLQLKVLLVAPFEVSWQMWRFPSTAAPSANLSYQLWLLLGGSSLDL